MKSALWVSVPQRIPQVSRLARVFASAMERKRSRSSEGRKTVRRGAPFSRYADGRKVNADSSSSSTGDGVDGVEFCESSYIDSFSGLGGTAPS